MAFSAYSGSTGSGKTYEVVQNVIVKALGQGRRVITNVAGLNIEKIHAYLRKQGIDEDRFGELVKLPPIERCAGQFAQIREIEDPQEGQAEAELVLENSLIRGGDVLVLDEVWRIWKRGAKIHPNDEMLWRMHRHILHPVTNVSVDIVLITQNWPDLNTTLRGLVHQRFVMRKHTSLGFSKNYIVSIYDQGARSPHVQIQRKFKQEIYNLYKSHTLGDGEGKEEKIDDRGNLIKRMLYTTVPAVIVLFISGAYGLNYFLHPPEFEEARKKAEQAKIDAAAKQNKSQQLIIGPDGKVVPATQASNTSQQSAEDSKNEALAKLSPYRVTGYIATPKGIVLLLDIQGTGLRQFIAPDDTVINGLYVELDLDGKLLGTMTGEIDRKRDTALPSTR